MSSQQCSTCGKRYYAARTDAKRAIRIGLRGHGLHVYECPVGEGYHLGHLPRRVRMGGLSVDHSDWRDRGAVATVARESLIEVITDNLAGEAGGRAAAKVALVQRVDDRLPSLPEVLEVLPDSLEEWRSTPPENWSGSDVTWMKHATSALGLYLQRAGWIAVSADEIEVGLGHHDAIHRRKAAA